MLTAALAVAVLVLLVAFGVACLMWWAAVLEIRALAERVRHLRGRGAGYRAELDALSIAPPAAVAALQPDAEPPIPAAWLADLHAQPTTYDREYPR